MSTQINGVAHVTIAGRYLGVFDVHEGGEVKAEVVKHRPGGSKTEKIYKVPSTVEQITVRRVYENARDQPERSFLTQQVGEGDASVGFQDLDESLRPYGKPFTYAAVLVGFKGHDRDSSSSEKAWLELTFEVEGLPS